MSGDAEIWYCWRTLQVKAGISINIQKDFIIQLWEIVAVEMEVSEEKKAHFFICANTHSVANLQSWMHLARGLEEVVCVFDFLEMDKTQEQGWAKQDEESNSRKKGNILVESGTIPHLFICLCV